MRPANREYTAVKIKWRQHELILITAIAVILIVSRVWNILHLSPDGVLSEYAFVFKEKGVPFNLYRNVIFPDVAVILVCYLGYLVLNVFSIPRLLSPRKFESGSEMIAISEQKINLPGIAKKTLKKYAWLLIQIALVIIAAGLVFDAATYYRHEWQFHYPGFSIFFNRHNPNSQLSLSAGFAAAALLIFIYGIYVALREFIIYRINTSKQHAYNVLIANKITGFLVPFVCVPMFLTAFQLIHITNFLAGYFLIIPSIFAMFISNVYWLFPWKGERPFFSKAVLTGLLTISFIYAFPLVTFVHEAPVIAFLYSWALQLFIVTPLTWWYYKMNEDKILQLRVVEKELVKSRADLQFLRSQINPHFLFNTLNTLYGIALQENASKAAEGIQMLGDMMRFMLHENNLAFIDIHKEIEYMKNYIALQKLRIESSPDIIIEDNIQNENCDHKIAPMLLLPLVENAFKHGISLKEKSWIKIQLKCGPKNIFFEVRNSMHVKSSDDPERERSGIGLKNVMERLKLIYLDKFQISVNGDGQEFFVQLSIQP